MMINKNVQSTEDSPQTEQPSSIDNRFQGIVALFGYDYLASARSRIVDADFTPETSALTNH